MSISGQASLKRRRRASGSNGGRGHGSALVMVLWLVALLMLITTTFSITNRQETSLTRNLLSAAEARGLAESGIYLAIGQLLADQAQRQWQPDGRMHERRLDEGDIRVAIFDESGKIDLNLAPPELLQALLDARGIAEPTRRRIVGAIVDWRDEDHFMHPSGAEDVTYEAAGLAYGAKDSYFDDVSELQLVMGVTPAIYARIADALTVHSRQSAVNPLHASDAVLAAIPGLTADDLREFEESRAEGEAGGSIAVRSGFLTLESNQIYSIHSEARAARGGVSRIRAVVIRTTDPVKPYAILDWQFTDAEHFNRG
jgi:general secretion pathway protein K